MTSGSQHLGGKGGKIRSSSHSQQGIRDQPGLQEILPRGGRGRGEGREGKGEREKTNWGTFVTGRCGFKYCAPDVFMRDSYSCLSLFLP